MGYFFIFLGIALFLFGWVIFRKEGVGLWTPAPIWRARHYLRGPGPTLWILGCGVALLGVIIQFGARGLLMAGVGAVTGLALTFLSSKQS